MSKKQVDNLPATSPTTAVALPFNYGEDAGKGLDLTLNDLRIPFIKLLQDDSKELDETEEKFILGSQRGQIMNTATKELIDGDKGLLLVPALKRRSFVEFLPDRQGFVADHEPNSSVVRRALAAGKPRNELVTEKGNPLVETKSLFAIVLDENEIPVGYVVVPFTSSKLGAWSDYFTQVDTMRVQTSKGAAKLTDVAPIFALKIRLTSKFTKNPKGKFFNYVMSPEGEGVAGSLIGPDHPGYVAAKSLAEAIAQGRAQADMSDMDVEQGSSDRHF